MQNSNKNILIIDFGSQLTQLIARRVRENGVYCEISPYNISAEELRKRNPKGIILSGGASSVSGAFSPKVTSVIFDLNIPILGICYGQQLMCDMLGGKVSAADHREFGRSFITVSKNSALIENVWEKNIPHQVWMSHGDKVTNLPSGFEIIASTNDAPCAIIANEDRKFYGVQFHPEVTHTPDGGELLKNFTHNICGCKGEWNMHSFLERSITEIRQKIGNKRVICGVSGGVDSSVVAALLHKAIGSQLTCIFINTGMLRLNEAEQVRKLFKSYFHIPLISVDASRLFINRLIGITDPEKKRKIIGETFIEIFDEESKHIGNIDFLAQGTLYPDVIESVSVHGSSAVIKSHHNVGGLPEKMNLSLIEPLRELFKDEVRTLGVELGMKKDMVWRHPFPGPGLAIRLPGEITKEKLEILRRADSIYIEEIKNSGLYDAIWQAFAVLLPVKTVGVMGDARTYEYVLALRAVTAIDGMTADYYHFDHEFLSQVSNRIINEVRGINRIVYDVTSKPPGTIEWE